MISIHLYVSNKDVYDIWFDLCKKEIWLILVQIENIVIF